MLYDNMPHQNRKTKLTFVETWIEKARSNGSINHIDNSEIRKKIELLMCAALKREPVKAWRISAAPTKGGWGPYWDYVKYVVKKAKNRNRVVIATDNDRAGSRFRSRAKAERNAEYYYRGSRIRLADALLYRYDGDFARLIGILRHLADRAEPYCDRHREIDEAIDLAYEAALIQTI